MCKQTNNQTNKQVVCPSLKPFNSKGPKRQRDIATHPLCEELTTEQGKETFPVLYINYDMLCFVFFSCVLAAYWQALLPTVTTGCMKPSKWETIECVKCVLAKGALTFQNEYTLVSLSTFLRKPSPNSPDKSSSRRGLMGNLFLLSLHFCRKKGSPYSLDGTRSGKVRASMQFVVIML